LTLDAAGCADAVVIALLRPTLIDLTLYNCANLTDAFLVHLAQQCPRLKTLHLEKARQLTDRGLSEAVAAGGFHDLEWIVLRAANLCGDGALLSLVNGCPALWCVWLFFGTSATKAGAEAARRRAAELGRNITIDGDFDTDSNSDE
jgi:hypothetical protein